MKRPVQILVNYLKEKNLTIAFAESITCGLVSHKLGTVNGTSDVFRGSVICYDESVKINLLKVKKGMIKKYTSESQHVTDALAINLGREIKADIHASITGLAAPGGSETKSKPVGTVFFSFRYMKKLYRTKKKFTGSPLQIKKNACEHLFKFITHHIKKIKYEG